MIMIGARGKADDRRRRWPVPHRKEVVGFDSVIVAEKKRYQLEEGGGGDMLCFPVLDFWMKNLNCKFHFKS